MHIPSSSRLSRRRFVHLAAATSTLLTTRATTAVDLADLAAIAGQLIIIGLPANSPDDKSAQVLAKQIAAGGVGGAVLLRHNIKTRTDFLGLTRLFIDADPLVLNAVDQEGGRVQRLADAQGFTPIPRAQWVSANLSTRQAADLYSAAGRELRAAGFNVNLAPSVDFHDPLNPVIGKHGRSFGSDAVRVAAYAEVFIEGMARSGVACSVKHFPGHGTSRGDSHDGFVDISSTWTDAELQPFRLLASRAPMVMGGHLFHPNFSDNTEPVTFSHKALTGVLRNNLGYRGVILTDDLDMGAIRKNFSLQEATITALQAGNDLLLMSNSLDYDPDLPRRFREWVIQALIDGRLQASSLLASYRRVMRLKRRFAQVL
jgi:beta-N-acetylhexosaminidase